MDRPLTLVPFHPREDYVRPELESPLTPGLVHAVTPRLQGQLRHACTAWPLTSMV